MSEWIVKIIATSLLLTICTYILPSGNIKKTALVLFGFVFVSVLVQPVANFSENDIFEEARLIFSGKYKAEAIQGEGGKMVVTEYTTQIENLVTERINIDSSLYCSHCKVYVNGDIESPDFGRIETIYCYVSEKETDDSLIKDDDDSIDRIVIDINGIHSGKEDEEMQDEAYKERACAVVAEYLQIDREKIHIMEIKE